MGEKTSLFGLDFFSFIKDNTSVDMLRKKALETQFISPEIAKFTQKQQIQEKNCSKALFVSTSENRAKYLLN